MLFCITVILSVTLQSHQVDGRSINSEDHEIQTSKGSNQLHETKKSLHSRMARSSEGNCEMGMNEYNNLERKIQAQAIIIRNKITEWESNTYEVSIFFHSFTFSNKVYFYILDIRSHPDIFFNVQMKLLRRHSSISKSNHWSLFQRPINVNEIREEDIFRQSSVFVPKNKTT